MPETYFNIKFNCTLFSEENNKLSDFPLEVEYFSVQENQWSTFLDGKTNGLGIFSQVFEIPLKLSKNEEKTRAVKDIISSGGIPSFRLVTKDPNNQSLIIAALSEIKIDNENLLITISFGQRWLLPENKWVVQKGNTIITSNHFDEITENDETKCQEKIDGLKQEILVLTKENSDLADQNESLNTSLTECKTKAQEKDKEIDNLKGTNAHFQNEIDALNGQLSNCNQEKTENDALITKLKQAITEGQNEILKLRGKNQELEDLLDQCKETRGSDLEEKYEELLKEFDKCQAQKSKLNEIIEDLNSDLRICHHDLNKCKKTGTPELEEKIKELEDKLSEEEQKNEDLEDQIGQITKEKDSIESKWKECKEHFERENPNKVEAKKVYKGILDELEAAKKSSESMPFQLKSFKMDLKTLVSKSPNGISYELIDMAQAKEIPSDLISTVELEVDLEETPESTSSSSELVPNTLGLTETAVRNKLNQYGLKLKPIYQSTESGATPGQSFKQQPEAGSAVDQNKYITVFFAKHKN